MTGKMRITDLHMAGNEHGELSKDTIYAKLVHPDGTVAISATLDYILDAIRTRGYVVEGVTVEWSQQRGAMCSEVKLDAYQR